MEENELPWIKTFVSVFFLIMAVHLILYPFLAGGKTPIIFGDGFFQYAYLRSILFDTDLDFSNEVQYISQIHEPQVFEVNGKYRNPWPIGSAIMWAPFSLVALGIVVLLNKIGLDCPVDGYSLPFQLAVAAGSFTYTVSGIYLSFDVYRRWFSKRIAMFSLILAWTATPLLYYSLLEPSMSHANSFFLASSFIWVWIKIQNNGQRAHYLMLGIIGGLITLVRTEAILFGVLPSIYLLRQYTNRKISLRELTGTMLYLIIPWLLMIIPQILIWRYFYSTVLPIHILTSLGWYKPHMVSTLFSTRHGLFTWTPLFLFGSIGLILFLREAKFVSLSFIALFLLVLYVESTTNDLNGGASFGLRRMVLMIPIIGAGFAMLLKRASERFSWLSTVSVFSLLSIWNLLFIAQYRLDRIPHMDVLTFDQMVIDKFKFIYEILKSIV